MTESGPVPVSVAALRTASVPSRHKYAVSESAWPAMPLANEHAPVDRIREREKRVQRQVETGYGSQCRRIYHVLGRGELVWCTSAEAQRLAERTNEAASRHKTSLPCNCRAILRTFLTSVMPSGAKFTIEKCKFMPRRMRPFITN